MHQNLNQKRKEKTESISSYLINELFKVTNVNSKNSGFKINVKKKKKSESSSMY